MRRFMDSRYNALRSKLGPRVATVFFALIATSKCELSPKTTLSTLTVSMSLACASPHTRLGFYS